MVLGKMNNCNIWLVSIRLYRKSLKSTNHYYMTHNWRRQLLDTLIIRLKIDISDLCCVAMSIQRSSLMPRWPKTVET